VLNIFYMNYSHELYKSSGSFWEKKVYFDFGSLI
jgi:hypothetical protein